MMDLVDRLKEGTRGSDVTKSDSFLDGVMMKAAEEIARLRAENDSYGRSIRGRNKFIVSAGLWEEFSKVAESMEAGGDIVERLGAHASDAYHPEEDGALCLEAAIEIVRLRGENERLRPALKGMVDHYTALVNCGDCGDWDPEEEAPVIAARKALAGPPTNA